MSALIAHFRKQQSTLFTELHAQIQQTSDYIWLFTHEDVSYYVPNDTSCTIVGVHNDAQLAVRTNVHEIDSIVPLRDGTPSEYAHVLSPNGLLEERWTVAKPVGR